MELPNFAKGLVTAVAQDAVTGEVLMVAFMNEEAFKRTVATGKAHYFSRSRNKLWLKGEESGHVQTVREIRVDCDGDAIVMKVAQKGAACHDGYISCFYRRLEDGKAVVTAKPVFDPKAVYGDK
ncbi:MAG: phosphoribosyl-AMP cyclohydrolase [Planctomycetota bacterium]